MDIPPLRALYELVLSFRKDKLWEKLGEDELFAVEMPCSDGSTVLEYCSVAGYEKNHYTLAVYVGGPGIQSYYHTLHAHCDGEKPDLADLMCRDCLTGSVDSKAALDERDMLVLQSLGLLTSGKNAYPYFRKLQPYAIPWDIRDEADYAHLTNAFLAACEVALRLGKHDGQTTLLYPFATKAELGFSQGVGPGKRIPLLRQAGDGSTSFEWTQTVLPPEEPLFYRTPVLHDELAARRMRRQKPQQHLVYLCELSLTPMVIGDQEDPDHPPKLAWVFFFLQNDTGILEPLLLADEDGAVEPQILQQFFDYLEAHGKPSELLVRDDRTYALLTGFAEQIGVPLHRAASLPDLAEAVDGFAEHIWAQNGQAGRLSSNSPRGGVSRRVDDRSENDALSDKPAPMRALNGGMDCAAPSKETARRAPLKERRAAFQGLSYILSVSIGKGCYRHLRISAGATFAQLAQAILDAFDFENDHLYAFFMDNTAWSDWDSILSPNNGSGSPKSTRVLLGERLEDDAEGQRFLFLFDYGDEWSFHVKVLHVLTEKTAKPAVIARKGVAPAQYTEGD